MEEPTSPLAPLAAFPPPPQSRAAEFYGFAALTGTSFLFILYHLWALLPDNVIQNLGVEWYPSREWALLVPAYSVILILLTYFTYWALAFAGTPSFNELSTITDSHAHTPTPGQINPYISQADPTAAPEQYDMPIGLVNQVLYRHYSHNKHLNSTLATNNQTVVMIGTLLRKSLKAISDHRLCKASKDNLDKASVKLTASSKYMSTMSNNNIMMAKRALRSMMKRALESLTVQEIAHQSGLTLAHILAHPSFKKAKVISCYLNMPVAELNTQELVRTILKEEKVLFVPKVNRDRNEINMIRVYDEEDLNSFPTGTWGIREPGLERNGKMRENAMDPESPLLDLIFLPGMAFDRSMSRLGHGKGYYDRFLTSYRAALGQKIGCNPAEVKMPSLMALCLSPQLLDSGIPMTEHDWKMDGIFHPEGLAIESNQ